MAPRLTGKNVRGRGSSIRRHPLLVHAIKLTDDEQYDLLVRAGLHNDSAAADKLTMSFIIVAISIASRYVRYGNVDPDDLVSESMRAVSQIIKRVQDKDIGPSDGIKLISSQMHSNCSNCIDKSRNSVMSFKTATLKRRVGDHREERIIYVDPQIIRHHDKVQSSDNPTQDAYDRLYSCCKDGRDRAVLSMLERGLSQKDIAETLGRSQASISNIIGVLRDRYESTKNANT